MFKMRVFSSELSSGLLAIVRYFNTHEYNDLPTGYVDDIDESLIRSIEHYVKNNRIFQAGLPPKSKIVVKLLKVCSKDEIKSHNIPHDHEDQKVIMSSQLKAYHIPVTTNSETTVSLDGRAFHFQTGQIYTIEKMARGLSIKNKGNDLCLHIVIEFLYFYDVFTTLDKTVCNPIYVPTWNKDSCYIVSSREGLYMIDMSSKRIDIITDIGTFGLVKCKERYLVFVRFPSHGSKGFEFGGIASFVINEEMTVEDWTVEARGGFDNETHQMTYDCATDNLYVLETGHQRVTIIRITDDGHFDKNFDHKTINIFEDACNPFYTKVTSPDYRHCNSISSDGCRIYVLCSNIYEIKSKIPSIGIFDMSMNLIDEITLDHAKGTYLHEVALSNRGRCVSYVSSDKYVCTLDLATREVVSKIAFETNEYRWQRGLLILQEDDMPAFDLALVGCGTSIQLISRNSVKNSLITPFYPCCIIGCQKRFGAVATITHLTSFFPSDEQVHNKCSSLVEHAERSLRQLSQGQRSSWVENLLAEPQTMEPSSPRPATTLSCTAYQAPTSEEPRRLLRTARSMRHLRSPPQSPQSSHPMQS